MLPLIHYSWVAEEIFTFFPLRSREGSGGEQVMESNSLTSRLSKKISIYADTFLSSIQWTREGKKSNGARAPACSRANERRKSAERTRAPAKTKSRSFLSGRRRRRRRARVEGICILHLLDLTAFFSLSSPKLALHSEEPFLPSLCRYLSYLIGLRPGERLGGGGGTSFKLISKQCKFYCHRND